MNPNRFEAVLKLINLFILVAVSLFLDGCATNATVTLEAPLDYQVFQRQTRLDGIVSIRGKALIPADIIEAKLTGTSISGPLPEKWQPVTLDKDTGRFHADLKTPAGGFYQLTIKTAQGILLAETTVDHVGIGEVFVISGQSNSSNYGEVKQRTETGMVTTVNSEGWRVANDPQPGVQDGSTQGSFIPSFGDAMYRKYKVPIGVASVGHGSTSVRHWLPKGTPVEIMPLYSDYVISDTNGVLVSDGVLYQGMLSRIEMLGPGGFRAVLWHQGESDSHQPAANDISAETYLRMMQHLISSERSEAGWNFPWFVAQATYHSPVDPACPPIREAQKQLWQSGLALEGPDTDTLTMSYRNQQGMGVHFNNSGLKAHGLLWAARVGVYLDEGDSAVSKER